MSRSSPPLDDLEQTIAGLLTRLRPRVKWMLASFRIPAAEGEDLVQEAYLSLVLHWPRIVHPEAWLLGALYLRCGCYLRTHRRRQWLQYLDFPLLEAFAPAQGPAQARAELFWDLNTLGALLPPRHRLILQLRYGLGLSTEEIAVRLGYRPGSIRKLSLRAIARIRHSASRLTNS